MFLDRPLSEKSAARFIEPGETIEAALRGERQQSVGDILERVKTSNSFGVYRLFDATAGNVVHVVITATRLRVISTDSQYGRPTAVVLDCDRAQGLGTLSGKNARLLNIGDLTIKLDRKNAELAKQFLPTALA